MKSIQRTFAVSVFVLGAAAFAAARDAGSSL